jgi:uncharacterized protein YjbI with pentapeptide repeats
MTTTQPTPTDQPQPESEEAQRRIVKIRLENQKIRLEQRLLKRQLSKQGLAMEWLKSVTVPVALLGAAITLYVGFGQINQSEQNRLADRFDKALVRLASDKLNERITGVSGLRLFVIGPESTSFRGPALHYLVNAVSVESDPLVQRAILNIFQDLDHTKVSKAEINEVLKTALDRNRSLTESIRQQWRDRITADQRARMSRSESINLPANEIPDPIPVSMIAKLSQTEYLEFLNAERGPFDELEEKEDVPLQGLTRLVSMLIALGATAKDFSGIYCEGCNFTTAGNLSEAKFDRAYLSRADFSHVNLRNASFRDSDLGGAWFFSSDLSNADLRGNTGRERVFNGTAASFPFLECANLKGADLTGTPLVAIHRDFSPTWAGESALHIVAPLMMHVQINDSTKLDHFTTITYTGVSDSYLRKHPDAPVVAPLHNREDGTIEDPVLNDVWTSAMYRRFQGDFAINESDYTSTMYIQSSEIGPKGLARLRGEIAPELMGYLDQPTLLKIPLLRDFDQTLRSLALLTRGQARPVDTDTQPKGRTGYSCTDPGHPDERRVVVDHGMRSSGIQ